MQQKYYFYCFVFYPMLNKLIFLEQLVLHKKVLYVKIKQIHSKFKQIQKRLRHKENSIYHKLNSMFILLICIYDENNVFFLLYSTLIKIL